MSVEWVLNHGPLFRASIFSLFTRKLRQHLLFPVTLKRLLAAIFIWTGNRTCFTGVVTSLLVTLVRFNCARNSFEYWQPSMGLKWKPRAFEPSHESCMDCRCIIVWTVDFRFFHLTPKKPRCCGACVCVWNIWRDVKLLTFFCRGHGATCPRRANEAADIWWMRYWTQCLVPARGDSIRLATKSNRSDLPGCCCIAGGHIVWWFCPSRHEIEPWWCTWMLLHSWWSDYLVILSVSPRNGTVVTHLDAVA